MEIDANIVIKHMTTQAGYASQEIAILNAKIEMLEKENTELKKQLEAN